MYVEMTCINLHSKPQYNPCFPRLHEIIAFVISLGVPLGFFEEIQVFELRLLEKKKLCCDVTCVFGLCSVFDSCAQMIFSHVPPCLRNFN